MRELIDAARAAKYAWDMVRYGQIKNRVATVVLGWERGQPRYSDTDYLSLAGEGYGKNALIFACIREIATSAAEAPLRVYKRTRAGDVKELPSHPLRQLIRRPNPFQTEFELVEDTLTLLNIAGNAYIEKERDRSGRVVGLWPVRPDRMTVVPGGDHITGYVYTIGEQEIPLPKEDIIHLRYPNPWNDYYGLSPISAIARVGDVDNKAIDYLKMFFDNGAVPMGILKTRQRIDQTEADRLKRRWKDRLGGQWHDVAVLDSEAEYQQVGANLQQIDISNLNSVTETRICMAFGVPPILVGADRGLERSTYSNYEEARRHFWDETLVPSYVRFGQKIDLGLRTEFDGQELGALEARFDLGEVRALREDVDELWRRSSDALRAGGMTVNMFLSVIGMDRIGEEGDVFLFPANAVPIHMNQLGQFMEMDDTLTRLTTTGNADQVSPGQVVDGDGNEQSVAEAAGRFVSEQEFRDMVAARDQHRAAMQALNGGHDGAR